MRRLILIAAALLAAPVAAQTSPTATDTNANTTENHGANTDSDAGTAGSDMPAAAGKPAKAKKHKSHTADSATSDRVPIDTSNYLPTTQNPY